MAVFRFMGIPEAIGTEVRQKMRAPGYGHPAHRETARGTGPCRLCLRTFELGKDERILFTYQPFLDPRALPAPGPVFIHAEECGRFDAPAVPPDFRSLNLALEGYGEGGRLLASERVGSDSLEEKLEQVFQQGDTRYVHIRNADAGCFVARVERCLVRD